MRLVVLRILLVVVLVVLIGRLYQLQIIEGRERIYANSSQVSTTRFVPITPRRGEILARDGQTLLAESLPIYSLGVLPSRLPALNTPERGEVLALIAEFAGITCTLVVSPATLLDTTPALRRDLAPLAGDPFPPALASSQALSITIPFLKTMDALTLARTYSSSLTLYNPVEPLIEHSGARSYQPTVIREDIPQTLALAVRENSARMPGVMVLQHYRRNYPQSGQVPSLSHVLGYTGRVSECELEIENPMASWLGSMLSTVSHIGSCRLQTRQIDAVQAAIPPYQPSDRIGKDGLEASYEQELRGNVGIDSVQVDVMDRPVSAAHVLQPVRDGENLVLTIDLAFQRQVEQIMRAWITESEARRVALGGHRKDYAPITSGVAVALDPRTGEVLAMVSLPDYDNNVWVDPSRGAELTDLLSPSDPKRIEEIQRLTPLLNRVIAGQYPPGSTLKQFVGSVALQFDVIKPTTRVRDPGKIILQEKGGTLFELPNSVPADNGLINVSDALKFSSNVFFASIAGGNTEVINLGPNAPQVSGLKIDRLAEGLQWFGFGRPTGIRLAGETSGRVPTPTWKSFWLREPWTTGDTYNAAIGQGYLEVTPLQLAAGTAAVANNGTIYRPQLVREITDSSGQVVQSFTPEVVTRAPVDPSYFATIHEGMRRSVTEGRNIAARDDCSGLAIAGKTGTAEFGPVITRSDGHLTRQSHSWFAGFAPYDDPQIAVVVLLEGTGDLGDGSATLAVPAVTQIMQAYFKPALPEKRAKDCPVMPAR